MENEIVNVTGLDYWMDLTVSKVNVASHIEDKILGEITKRGSLKKNLRW